MEFGRVFRLFEVFESLAPTRSDLRPRVTTKQQIRVRVGAQSERQLDDATYGIQASRITVNPLLESKAVVWVWDPLELKR